MIKWEIVYAPRSQRDLDAVEKRFALQILRDHDLLKLSPWPLSKVKRLRGVKLWEIKTGDFRSLFVTDRQKVVILRVINRRDLERVVGRIDVEALLTWIGRT